MYKLIIIGSGPAGLAAAIYAARAELAPLLIAAGDLGGQLALTEKVENYPGFPQGVSGAELAQLMQEQAKRFGARVELELDEEGYIVTDLEQRTSVPGVFTAGDVQERVLRQIATAVGTGAKAAMEAERYIAELEGRAYRGWKPLEV